MVCESCSKRMKEEQEHDGGRTYGLPTKTPCPEKNKECSFNRYHCGIELDDRHDCEWHSTCRDMYHGCGHHLKQCKV